MGIPPPLGRGKESMGLNAFTDEARAFVEKIGAEESADEILYMIAKGAKLLERFRDDRDGLCHQLYDLMFLLFELAAKCDFDMDAEWEKGREKKAIRYLKP
jgi:hypothetical protein